MKVFEHQRQDLAPYPSFDQINYVWDWSRFESDPRTENIDIHIGCFLDYSKIRNDKINIHLNGEWPNSWFNGKTRGQNIPGNLEIEKRFDYIFSVCRQTAAGRGYIFAPYAYDFDHIFSQVGIRDIDEVEKDIDVFMCATCPGEYDFGENHPVWPWFKVMEKFNHVFCNSHWKTHTYPWKEKQLLQARSKISIVFTDFIGATPQCRTFAKENIPWVKFKNNPGEKPVTPQPKGRVLDAASTKSFILCHRSPFVGDPPPYNSAIEDYLEPDVDFLYFNDSEDLEKKISEILDGYNSAEYKNTVDSAYNKVINNFNLDSWYENNIVPLAIKGKKI